MASFNDVLTENGQALINKMLAGKCTIQFTKMMCGDGSVAEGQSLSAMTGLVNPKSEGTISITHNSNIVNVTGTFKNEGLSEGMYLREKGIFASDGTEEVLMMYANCGDEAEWIEPAIEGVVEKVMKCVMTFSQSDNISVVVSSEGYVLRADYDADMEFVALHGNGESIDFPDIKIPSESVACDNASIKKNEAGELYVAPIGGENLLLDSCAGKATGGWATLDASGQKVLAFVQEAYDPPLGIEKGNIMVSFEARCGTGTEETVLDIFIEDTDEVIREVKEVTVTQLSDSSGQKIIVNFDCSKYLPRYLYIKNAGSGSISYRRIKAERGNVSTDFSMGYIELLSKIPTLITNLLTTGKGYALDASQGPVIVKMIEDATTPVNIKNGITVSSYSVSSISYNAYQVGKTVVINFEGCTLSSNIGESDQEIILEGLPATVVDAYGTLVSTSGQCVEIQVMNTTTKESAYICFYTPYGYLDVGHEYSGQIVYIAK